MNNSLSKFIYKGKHSQCLLFSLKKAGFLKEHRATVDVMIILKRGIMKISHEGKETVLLEGEYLLLDANIMHAVYAISDIEFYLFKLAPAENKKDITTRVDVELLVSVFYNKVKQHEQLAPIFSKRIFSDEQWEQHLTRMSDFWETVLFAKQAYRGNPFPKHVGLEIMAAHFETWISLFHQTINENFAGPKATEAKERADKMRVLFESKLFGSKDGVKHLV
ncbi:MAG: hypothetical protein QM737_00075 [Ferruginibacter sp.]